MKLALLALVAACSRASPPADPPPPPPVGENLPQFGPDPLVDATELVLGIVDNWDATRTTLRRYRRIEPPARTWTRVGTAWPAVVGRSGIAWGIGLHGDGAPSGLAGPIKREGDGKSPAGMFRIAKSYGYAAQPPAGTKLPYVQSTDHFCVDDPASAHYARIVGPDVAVDWKSHEVMRRADELYEWVIDIAHNAAHVPSKGSCIFFHVWSGEASSTLGCTAMAEPVLRDLVATLDPSTVFVLLTRDAYDHLRQPWHLPPL